MLQPASQLSKPALQSYGKAGVAGTGAGTCGPEVAGHPTKWCVQHQTFLFNVQVLCAPTAQFGSGAGLGVGAAVVGQPVWWCAQQNAFWEKLHRLAPFGSPWTLQL
mmetsp:Transcript_117085/g.239519  ORF Transcript_117085/g.239519 Transcript_117085/m.239519 type:complete len:106 (+) Transcript_117085:404-721(+)